MATRLLDRARVAYEQGRWDDAYRTFHDAGAAGDLDVDDLSALADAAWWLGHNDESLSLSEQVYQRLVAADLAPQAAQVAVELGFLWFLQGSRRSDPGGSAAPGACWSTFRSPSPTAICCTSRSRTRGSKVTMPGRSN